MIFSMILFLFSLLVSPGYFQYESMNLDVVERLAVRFHIHNPPINHKKGELFIKLSYSRDLRNLPSLT